MKSLTKCLVLVSLSIVVVLGQDIPSVVPADPFDPSADARTLYNAIDGWGTDEDAIIRVLTRRSAAQRAVITATYGASHGSLEEDLKGDLGGEMEPLAVMLTHSTDKFLALELHNTIAGLGTDESSLIEILISRTNEEMRTMRVTYGEYYLKTPEADIESDTLPGPFRSLLIRMLDGSRDETNVVDPALVDRDVDALYEAGPGTNGTDERIFVGIFGSRNYAHISAIELAFDAKYGPTDILASVVTNEFGADMQNALFAILQYARNKAAYLAARFHRTISQLGTKDHDLQCITVARCEIDMGNIREEYLRIYGTTLHNAVSDDTSGPYRTALLNLIG